MEILKITPSDNKLWEQVWRLYTNSFPEHERRRISSHVNACEDKDFHTYIALENGNLLALLFYWTNGDTIYIEHIAVNPELQGQNIGSKLMHQFINENKERRIILEIEPPIDEQTTRRLSFYEKLGFATNDYHYMHPSYSKNGMEHELRILSLPAAISQEEFDIFCQFIAAKVLKYTD